MSYDGFLAKVKIDDIDIAFGHDLDEASISLVGTIRLCRDAQFDYQLPHATVRPGRTDVRTSIDVRESPHESFFWREMFAKPCIGNMYVRARQAHELERDSPFDLTANLSLALSWLALTHLLQFQRQAFIIAPVFVRKAGESDKWTEQDEKGGLISFIERINISPVTNVDDD